MRRRLACCSAAVQCDGARESHRWHGHRAVVGLLEHGAANDGAAGTARRGAACVCADSTSSAACEVSPPRDAR
jgi:hypothetical protein